MIEAELQDGRILEFPDGTDPSVIQATVKKMLQVEPLKPTPQSSGILGEAGKGLLRGASNVGLGVGEAASKVILGPMGGALATQGIKSLAAPSTELVAPTPTTPSEKFAGTAGEIAGGSIAGGGAGSIRGALMTGGAALGGAEGEREDGDLGKFLGTLAGAYGTSAAISIGRKLGMTLADIGATVNAGFGGKRGVERLASKAVTEKSGEEAQRIKEITKAGGTEYVKGAKPTVGEVLTEAQVGKPEQIGGATVRLQKELYGARGVEDVLPTVAKQQAEAVRVHLTRLEETTKPMREMSLNAANARGIDPKLITDKIDEALAVPEKAASDVINSSLNSIKEKLLSLPKVKGGGIDAKALYTQRKEIGNTIEKFSKESANWDKRLTSSLQRDVQRWMDDAIEQSGGIGWKNYLKTYSEGMKAVDAQAERLKQMKMIQAQVKGQPVGQMVAGEIQKPPTLLHRGMMAINYGLSMIAHDANDPVVKKVANAMKDPQEFSRLVKLPLNHPDRKALHYVLNALISTKLDQALPAADVEETIMNPPATRGYSTPPTQRDIGMQGARG